MKGIYVVSEYECDGDSETSDVIMAFTDQSEAERFKAYYESGLKLSRDFSIEIDEVQLDVPENEWTKLYPRKLA